jgi:hypothetical protein
VAVPAAVLPGETPSCTLVPKLGLMPDDDCWAVRAELEARKEEVATLRGVVAALRTMHSRVDTPRKAPPGWVTVAVVGVSILAIAALVATWVLCEGPTRSSSGPEQKLERRR